MSLMEASLVERTDLSMPRHLTTDSRSASRPWLAAPGDGAHVEPLPALRSYAPAANRDGSLSIGIVTLHRQASQANRLDFLTSAPIRVPFFSCAPWSSKRHTSLSLRPNCRHPGRAPAKS